MAFLQAKNRARHLSPKLVLLVAVGFSLAVSLANFSMVSSATITVKTVSVADGSLPATDPNSDLWKTQAKAVEVPLSAQQMVRPSGGSTRTIYVRALDDSKTLAVMISWADDTMNMVESDTEASDAVAIQWPLTIGTSTPFQCMGQLDAPVNIWQWKASHQAAIETNHTTESPVYNLISNGICKAADTPGMIPMGKGVWGDITTADGQMMKGWNVVFSRDYNKGGSGAADIEQGTSTNMAFAVWNGAPPMREMKSRKAVASWVSFNSEAGNRLDLTWLNLLVITLVAALIIVAALILVPKQSKAPAVVGTPQVGSGGQPLADTPAARAMAITARSKRV